MPIYEFYCPRCGGRTSFLLRQFAPPPPPLCPHCSQVEMKRLYTPVGFSRSLKDVHESSGDPDKAGPDYYKDPRNIGRWVEKRFQEMGQELPTEIKDMIQAAREGELPSQAKELQPGVKEL